MPRDSTVVLAQRVLELLQGDPGKLTKSLLLTKREKVMELCQDMLAEPTKPVTMGRWSADYAKAIRIVLGYDGSNEFLLSLQDSVLHYGNLTPRQMEAVLRPPLPKDEEQLAVMGVKGVKYAWQVREALAEARQRDLQRMREELAEARAK